MAKSLGSARVSAEVGDGRDAATHLGDLDRPSSGTGGGTYTLTLSENSELERLGPYEVAGVLGRGGMGVVYEVVDQRTGAVYALKTIETRFLALPESNAEQRFRQEISVLERLDHRGIVRLYDSGFAHHPLGYDVAFFAMERLSGETLDADIKAGRVFELDEALDLIAQLADALDYLSRHNVLHRDIKPGNIFRESNGRVVLMDFGLARSDELTRLTLAGQIVGTFGYMSPERLIGKRFDISSDVYALGVVLYQLLAGQHPFNGTNPTETLELIRRGIAMPPAFDQLPYAEQVKSLILSLLSYRAEDRPTAADLSAQLRDLLGRTGETRRDSGTALPTVRGTERRARARPVEDPASRPRVVPVTGPPATRTQQQPVGKDSELTPVIAPNPGNTSPRDAGAAWTGGGAATSQPAPYAFLPRARGGPSWSTAGMLSLSTACLAFVLGFFLGRGEEPERSIQVPVQSEARPAEVPAVRPIERPREEALRPASSFNDPTAAFLYGELLIDSGRYQAAVEVLNRALQLNPAYADAHRRLGDAHAGLGDLEHAAGHYKSYLALRPNAPDADKVRRLLKNLP